MRRAVYACLIALLLIIPGRAVLAADSTAIASRRVSPELLNSLREGGYILFVRHGEATVGEDHPNLVFSDCSTQRNLSEEGKRNASLFGKALRSLRIPIRTPVSASPFCRTRESAELAFGKESVQPDPFWIRIYNLSGKVTTEEKDGTLKDLTSVLEKAPPSGTNQVIVAHSFPKGVGLGEIPYLGTVVVKPRGQGKGFDVVDKFSIDELLNSH
ncbi:histidine phosphatase family protein [Paenibacillus sp. FJAT-26967]|uniref:histidine phosphatase family protein n=1 Tax=Paenibacillus sp. FJAT-26967 TaxID=1729690 RepID=UPI000B07A7A0|nr:histidine phosphatase family protein [Paenibacillus sp. FJAT-26967]